MEQVAETDKGQHELMAENISIQKFGYKCDGEATE